MSNIGVIQEQGFLEENQGFGFKPIKENDENPFNTSKRDETEKSEKK